MVTIQQPSQKQNVAKGYNMEDGRKMPYGGILAQVQTSAFSSLNGSLLSQGATKCNKIGTTLLAIAELWNAEKKGNATRETLMRMSSWPAQEGAVEVTYKTLEDLVQRFHDHTKEIPICHFQVIKSVQRDQGYGIVVTGQQSTTMLERIRELEQDNIRLRDMMDVANQRVARSQRWELRRTMPNTRSGASRTRKGINEQIDRQMVGALGACTTAKNLKPLMRDGGSQEEVNGNGGNRIGGNRYGGNGNGGNGNGGNGNGGNGILFNTISDLASLRNLIEYYVVVL
ncbi:hypothetical protein Tco_0311398 [Tanacetum coccineum]